MAGAPDDQHRHDRERGAGPLGTEPQRRPQQEGQRQIDECRCDVRREVRLEHGERHCQQPGEQRSRLDGARASGRDQLSAAARVPRDDHRHEGERRRHVRKHPRAPDLPIRCVAKAVELDERRIEKRREKGRRERGDHECADVEQRAEREPLPPQQPQARGADQRFGHVAHEPAQHHHDRHTALDFGEQMRRQRRRSDHPPRSHGQQHERGEDHRVRRPQHRDGIRNEREREAEPCAEVVPDEHERSDAQKMQARLARDREGGKQCAMTALPVGARGDGHVDPRGGL